MRSFVAELMFASTKIDTLACVASRFQSIDRYPRISSFPKEPSMLKLLSIISSVALFSLFGAMSAIGDDVPLTRIAFGSCAKQDQPQPIWDAVVDLKPQLFVFLGDNIYGDSIDMDALRAKYALLATQPGLQKLRQSCPVVGTWDDHDFGANDAGAEYPMKRESQQVFLDFFEVSKDDPRRQQEGVYSTSLFGPVGKRVQLILLDTRYFRSPLKTGYQSGEPGEGYRGIYGPNSDPKSTILGETQWRWLEDQLKIPAELRVIGSSIQLIANEHGSEMWENFPHERVRFLKLLRATKANGVVVLSGDRHLAEISRLQSNAENGIGYPLFDLTSSSLNAPSGNFTKAGTRFANQINSHRVGLQYFDTNFGSILIDWDQPDPVVRLQVRDEKGDIVLQQRVSLSQLRQ
jgi:alkaline phosphatase D